MKVVFRRSAQVLIAVAVLAVLALWVFPTRTYLSQREATQRAEERLAVLQSETADLDTRAAALDTDSEIERLARADHGLVMPGEEAYVVLRPPLPPVDLPHLWLVGDPDGAPGDGLASEAPPPPVEPAPVEPAPSEAG